MGKLYIEKADKSKKIESEPSGKKLILDDKKEFKKLNKHKPR